MKSNDIPEQLPPTIHALLEQKAATLPEHRFLMIDGRSWTFAEINRHAEHIATRLHERGVRQGDRVAVMMASSETYIALWFAISKLGAVEVPINAAYHGDMLTQILVTVAARLAITDAALREPFVAASSGLLSPGDILDAADPSFALPDQYDGTPITRGAPTICGRDPACIVLTSGTTGASKGVVMSHTHLLSFGLFFTEIVQFTRDDVAYNFLPFFHVAAKFLSLGAILSDASMAVRPVFSLSAFWDDVRRYRATLCVAVGGLCHMLASVPERNDDANNPLRLIYAVPVPWEFKDGFERRFGLSLVEAYGSTESNLNIYTRLHEATPHGSCGRASPHFEVTIRDENCREVPRGTAGEICVRPRHPHTMLSGYFGLPEKTLEAMENFWFHTGDQAYMDENGYVFFQDRLKDAIRRRGENISSFEVERLLNAHPEVAETAAIPVKSDVGEEEVKVVVVRREGSTLSEESLLRFCVETMPYFMVPRFIEFREQLPRTPTMKVKKVELRREGRTAGTWDCEAAGFRITRRGLERR